MEQHIKIINQFGMKYFLLLNLSIILVFSVSETYGQKKLPENFCITQQEEQLFKKLNKLLQEYGEKPLKLSASLSYVAKVHVNDLTTNRPDTSICNLSSWSDQGDWTSCCYNPYVLKQDCMWDKPKELTPYPYRGYELVSFFEDDFNVDSIIKIFSETKEVLDMLLMRDNFKDKKWVCMGVGQNERYASVWFGQRADAAAPPAVCADSLKTFVPVIATVESNKAVTYYLIIASLSDPQDAKEAVKRYRKNGFENCGTIKNGEMTRIYLDQFTNLKEAMYAKQQLPYTYREAWIYKE